MWITQVVGRPCFSKQLFTGIAFTNTDSGDVTRGCSLNVVVSVIVGFRNLSYHCTNSPISRFIALTSGFMERISGVNREGLVHRTLVTLGRLTDVSLNKNGGSREAVKNKGSVWVEGERIRSPFLTRRKMTQKPNHSRNKFSLHLILFEIFEIHFFFLKFNTFILRTNGLKYDMGCYIKIQIFD